MTWHPLPKPAEIAETRLLEAILDGTFPIDSTLPGERDLAAQIGVTRPTLRETMQRLARDGWLDIQHGKPTRVRDYWREGSLGVLNILANQGPPIASLGGQSHDFVAHLMEIRLLLAPAYTRQALASAVDEVKALLDRATELDEDPAAFARFDWELHHLLTKTAENPVFCLLLNSFERLYGSMAERYFSFAKCRQHSRNYYAALRTCIEREDLCDAKTLTRRTMAESLDLWQQLQ
jgi:GntR family negative regulator for fad regulon and positive regulator of fabA